MLSLFFVKSRSVSFYVYTVFKTSTHSSPTFRSSQAIMINHIEIINLNHDATFNDIHPLSLSTSMSDNETYNIRRAMNQDDREDFILSIAKERNDHEVSKHWERISASKMKPGS